MAETKLHLSIKKFGRETTVISVRLPVDMLKQIDETCEKTGRKRNDIIIKSISFALENLAIEDDKQGK